MTFASVIVEVGFTSPSTGIYLHLGDAKRGILGTATLAPVDLWVDVSEWVTSVSTRRGATRADGPVLRYESGTATIVLRNEDRRFDPTNLDGPYVASGVSQVEPMRAVRIRATWGDVTYPLWRGFADDWQVIYTGPNTSEVILTCSDAFSVFASYDRDAIAAVGSGEDSGARIGRILTSAGWSTTDRVVDTGDVTLQSTTLADNALTELLLTADSELGEFWMDPQGRTVFRRRLAIQEDARSALAQATFGDLPNDGVNTTINLASNPSLETDTTGWRATGSVPPTLARSTVQALYGTHSLLATWDTGGVLPGVAYDIEGLTVGKTYTISLYVYVPSGSPDIAVISGGVWGTPANTGGLVDQWVRMSWTGLADATTRAIGIWPVGGATAGQQVYIDGLQVEEGTTATPYVDGDQGNSEWDGVAHASTSRRLPELPYADLTITSDRQSMANLISIANNGGTAQVVEDPGSRTAYLTRTYQRHDLLMQTDAAALVYGEQILARTSIPEQRPSQVVLNPRGDAGRLYPQALGREIGDRVRIVRRPPGGGDAIERDVWVRGIQHDISSALTWRTTFALQKAPTITTVTDAFTRTTSNGWDTSDSGHVWATSGGAASDYSVSSGQGHHSLGSVNVFRRSIAGSGIADVDITCNAKVPVLATGAAIAFELLARFVDGSNLYYLQVRANTDQSMGLRFVRVVGGTSAIIATLDPHTGETHQANDNFAVRFRVVGSLLQAKLWHTPDPEPASWDLAFTDSTPHMTAGGVGCRSSLFTGNANALPVAVDFDNFTATSLYVWA